MGIKNCEILLDNQWNTYYAGQIVGGHVKLTLDKVKTVQAITIRFKGEAKTQWSESYSYRDREGELRRRSETLYGSEEYFNSKVYLVGGEGGEIELAAGTYDYTFSYQLPPTLPSSFEGEYGFVRYTIKVTLDRPWKFDQDVKMAFTVITPVDLNMRPALYQPYKLELEKTFCCLCCESGPLAVITSIPVTGYVSGQVIPITCECDNASDVNIEGVRFVLRKQVHFTVTTPRYSKKQSKITIAELSVGPVMANESRTFARQFEIPALPATNLLYCGIISLDYELHIVCEVSGAHTNLTGNIPITLGTIPLASYASPAPIAQNNPTNVVSMQSENSASPATGTGGAIGWNIGDTPAGVLFPALPPPQFVETGFKAPELRSQDEDTEHTRIVGEVNYAPRYPTFQFQPTAPDLNNTAPE